MPEIPPPTATGCGLLTMQEVKLEQCWYYTPFTIFLRSDVLLYLLLLSFIILQNQITMTFVIQLKMMVLCTGTTVKMAQSGCASVRLQLLAGFGLAMY